MSPIVITNAALVGGFAFAGMYHWHQWRQPPGSRVSLLIAAFCGFSSLMCLALVGVGTATTIAAVQRAIDARTLFGLLSVSCMLVLLSALTGERPRWFMAAVSAVLGSGVVVTLAGVSVAGQVTALTTTTLPWGEPLTVIQRQSPVIWYTLALYVALSAVFVFAIIAGVRWSRRDRLAGVVTVVVGISGLAAMGVGVLVDLWGLRAPYLGQVPYALWIVLLTVRESGEHAARERRLQASERRFRAIFDQTFQFTGLMSTDGRVLEANRTALAFAGIPEDQVIGRYFWDTAWWSHSPELQQRLKDAVARATRGEMVRFEATHPRPDGTLASIDFSLKPVRDENGEVTLLIPEGRDISERVEAERSLRASEASLAAVIDYSPNVAMQWYDEHGRVVRWNRSSETMFGYSAEEAIGKTLDQLIHTPGEFADFLECLAGIQETGQPVGPVELSFRRRSQEIGICVSTVFQVPGASTGARFVCMDVDITERKRAEQALAMSESRYRTLIESAPEAIVVFDLDTERFVDCNPEACRLFGATDAELRRLSLVHVNPPRQPDGRPSAEAAAEHLRQAVQGGTPVFEWTHRTLHGQDVPCEVRLVRLPDPEHVLIRGSVTDISQRRALEEQLRQAQKMEAIGQLAGGVAHDFNNLLTVIAGFADLLHDRLPSGDEGRELVKVITDATDRAAWLTARLLAFGRRAVLSPQVLDLNVLVSDGERILRRLIGEHIALDVRVSADPLFVEIDSGQWSQLMLNLAINARDAMPAGGTLTIETARQYAASDVDPRAPDSRPGEVHAVFRLRDTGIGMPQEVRAHIFEPFFTTKEVGKGTGLGLAVVHGIVTQARGRIDVETTPGCGTTFSVFLPIAVQVEQPALLTATSGKVGGGECVLVVEDEDILRKLLQVALTEQGFRVVSARDGNEALQLLESPGLPPDLMVTDMVMPGGFTGRELADVVRRRHPRTKVLFITGYTDDPVVRSSGFRPGEQFLQKPFSLTAIAQKAREALDLP